MRLVSALALALAVALLAACGGPQRPPNQGIGTSPEDPKQENAAPPTSDEEEAADGDTPDQSDADGDDEESPPKR